MLPDISSKSMVLEKIILQLYSSHHNRIRPEQFTFFRGHSTTLQLVNLMDHLSANLNSKLHTASIFLDIEKAFDCVWHIGLLYKMLITEILINFIQIFMSFLSVKIKGHISSTFSSRLLYLIYTNVHLLYKQQRNNSYHTISKENYPPIGSR